MHEPTVPDTTRAPLPPGDPIAWGLLVAGSCLEGTLWPGWGSIAWDCPTQQGTRAKPEGKQ